MTPKTAAAIRRLRWPKALLENYELTNRDHYRVGKLIVKNVRPGPGREGVSVRELADVLNISHPTLYRAVKAYQMVEKYGLQGQLDKVPATLLYNVDRLPSDRRRRFLSRALKLEWSKREIERQVSVVLEKTGGRD